ncbi:MAG: hypothetical protein Q7R57_10310, partial [Dehalococcoidales bacterium]|nr:hypothetical protein [Dehalococcoidales bacterium]
MKQLRLLILSILLGSVLLLSLPGAFAAAADNTTPTTPPATPPKIELAPTYPKLTAIAGGTFEFEVALKYTGDNPLVFDLRTTAPKGWDVFVTPQYQKDKKIQSIRLESGQYGSPSVTTVLVTANAPVWPLPDPGDYNITLETTSGAVKGSTTLVSVITAKYILYMVPASPNQLY